MARTAARVKGLVGIGCGLPHHQTLFSCSSEPKAQKSRPLWEGGGSEVGRHPGTCLQGPGLLGCLCCQPREAAPGGGRRIANSARWPKTLRERGWRAGRGRGGVGVPPTLPPASARGISRASVADGTLVLQRLLLDKAPDSRAGGLLQPRKPEARLLSAGRGLPESEALSWSSLPHGAARRSREAPEAASTPTPTPSTDNRLATQECASSVT